MINNTNKSSFLLIAIILALSISLFAQENYTIPDSNRVASEISTKITTNFASNIDSKNNQTTSTFKTKVNDTKRPKVGLVDVTQKISPEEWISKGRILTGFNASFNQAKMKDLDFNIILAELADFSGHTVEVSGYAGYFFKDAIGFGLRLGYNRFMYDIKFTLSGEEPTNIQYLNNKYFGEIFLRNYIRLGQSYSFYFFNETSIRFDKGKGILQKTDVNEINKTLTDSYGLQIGLRPGIAIMLTKGFAFETSVSLLGLKTSIQNSTINGEEKRDIVLNSLDFDINLLKINFGMNWYI